jgi:hypothetical protein
MRSNRFSHGAHARLAVVAVAMLGLGACAPDTDLQDAEQNLHVIRAKIEQDQASGNQAQIAADAAQLAQAEFVLKYDRMQWPGDWPGHGGHAHSR